MSYPEALSGFVERLLATCPPGYELDEMHIERLGDASNNSTVVVTWKPGVSSQRGG